MKSEKAIKTTGWVLTGALALLFAISAFMKLSLGETAIEQANAMGLAPMTLRMIGIVEITSVILFIIPRTGILGSLLLIAYMGGAIVVHLLNSESIAFAVIIEILIWITAALRFPELKKRLFNPNGSFTHS